MKMLFPFTIVGLMACAAVPYALAGDWRRAAYWALAAAINLVVTI